MTLSKLPRTFYGGDTAAVARALLGKFLVHRVDRIERIGMIVETEAYLGTHDLAAHSSHGKTRRNASMFGPIGHAYVYLVYGVHECFNVVTEEEGKGAAVLIRALEPVQDCAGRTNGPGLLTKAMAITRALDGCDLLGDELFIASAAGVTTPSIRTSHRIGVNYAGRWAARLLRYCVRDNPHVSRK
jgi:DNA-3-methyladenine glycosylase